jgi:hypothetical protein
MSSLQRARRTSALTASLAAALLTLGLAACSPSGGGSGNGTGDPGGTEEPGTTGPQPALELACDDLAPLEDIRAAFNDALEPDDFPVEPGGTWPLSQIGLVQAGALRCHWSDAADQQGQYVAELEVTALPDAAEEWTRWHDTFTYLPPVENLGDAAYGSCDTSATSDWASCRYGILIGATWLRIDFHGVGGADLALPVAEAVTDAVGAASATGTAWTPPASALAVPADCAALVTAEEVGAIVATEGMAAREASLLMPLLYNAGLAEALDCSWSNSYSSAQAMPVGVTVLPGAGWAWEAEWAKERLESRPVEARDGLGEAAFAGCAEDQDFCHVDVLADGAWISVTGNSAAGIDALATLAQKTLDALGYAD